MTDRQTRWYSYVIVGLLGLVALFLPIWLLGLRGDPSTALTLFERMAIRAAIYGVLGFLAGALWPKTGWKWGLVLVTPLLLLLVFSLLFAGYLVMFLSRDLPVLVVYVSVSCAAAYMGQRWTTK